MDIWLQSRLLSYCTIVELLDYLAEFSAIRMVTARTHVMPSEFVDIVDSAMPLEMLIFYEILFLAGIFGLLVLGYKIAQKEGYSLCSVLRCFGNILFWMGVFGVASRLITLISYACFLKGREIHYEALPLTVARDVIYLLSGILLRLAVKYISTDKWKRWVPYLKKALKICGVIWVVSIVVLNLFLKTENLQLLEENEQIRTEYASAQEEASALQKEVNILQEEKEDTDKALSLQKYKYTELYYEKAKLESIIKFFDENIALVVSDGSKLYHTYDCRIFQDADRFWAYNITAAKGNGYKPCKKCH